MGVANNGRTPATDEVDIFVAVDIDEPRAARLGEKDRRATDATEGAHRRIDATRDVLFGALEERF
jgi:hypothetical protein